MDAKVWCSSIRNGAFRLSLEPALDHLIDCDENPREGDIVVARVSSDHGAYRIVEDPFGREVNLYEGDCFVGVLGARESGTNLTASLPPGPIRRGQILHLVAVGGLIGEVTCVPKYYQSGALPVGIVGFVGGPSGKIANLRDGATLTEGSPLAPRKIPILFVGGTSAEAGKTTLVCNTIRALCLRRPGIRIGAIKVCGTGRLRDLFRYRDAGAIEAFDFVDAGWPSTYNLTAPEYLRALTHIITAASARTDFLIAEMGGDLLAGKAPEAIDTAIRLNAHLALVANDAMGTIAGLHILKGKGASNVHIATMSQNPRALAKRLNLPSVIDLLDKGGCDELASTLCTVFPRKPQLNHQNTGYEHPCNEDSHLIPIYEYHRK